MKSSTCGASCRHARNVSLGTGHALGGLGRLFRLRYSGAPEQRAQQEGEVVKTIDLNFKGYRREEGWELLPSKSGIYCVYAATPDGKTRKLKNGRLLYIGESDDMRRRVPEKPKKRRDKWAKELSGDEILCVSYAQIEDEDDRERAEAAMIYHHQPPCNEEYADSFPFNRTRIRVSGKTAKLTKQFTVDRDD